MEINELLYIINRKGYAYKTMIIYIISIYFFISNQLIIVNILYFINLIFLYKIDESHRIFYF